MVVDAAVLANKERFTTFETVKDKFGPLSNFQDLSQQELMKQAELLSHTLHHGGNLIWMERSWLRSC